MNGFTAEGIYYAMVSGELAAKAVAATRLHGHTRREGQEEIEGLASRYNRACNREIGAELRDSVLIQRHLFADRRRITSVIAGAKSAPVLTRLVLDFAGGRLSYSALRRQMLARAPLLAGHLLWARLRNALSRRVAADTI